jgi:hypothetical protein
MRRSGGTDVKALFCDLDLHLWGELDFARDLIECDLCGHQVLAEVAFRRGNTLPPIRNATGSRPDWLRRGPDALSDLIKTRLADFHPIANTNQYPNWTLLEIQRAVEHIASLPPQPATLRVGPGVTDYLRLIADPVDPLPGYGAPLDGVPIVPTDGYRTGEWRMFDTAAVEIGSGQIEALNGMPADVKVITSPLLPPGVSAIAYSPATLRPHDPDYPLYGLHAVAVRDDPPEPG